MFLQVDNISFGYNDTRKVLRQVSFNLKKGQTLSVVGSSGCGKSTLLRIISGILPINQDNSVPGKILINNQTPDEYRKSRKLAFMFQDSALMPNLTVKQNIEFPLKIKGNDSKRNVEELLEKVGLLEFSNFLPKQLSGGMRTRVALARSFVTEPELLLLDEPFSALDIAWKSDLYQKLELLRAELGFTTTVVIVTHDVQEAILLSDKVIFLNREGSIQDRTEIESIKSPFERVKNINRFLGEPAFQNLFQSIQNSIMTDGARQKASEHEVLQILDQLIASAGNEDMEQSFDKDKLNVIRDFANEVHLNKKLLSAFRKAKTDLFKYQLIWDILEFDELPIAVHEEIFFYYIRHIDVFSGYSRQWYAIHDDQRFFEILKGRIETVKGFSQKKKWIYLCDLYAVRRWSYVKSFLDDVTAGKVDQVNNEFAHKVAKKIKEKILNEENTNIHTA